MTMNRAASTIGFCRTFAALVAATVLPACVGEVDDGLGGDPAAGEDEAVATFSLATGQKVEFYDLGGDAMISETGPAGLPRVLDVPREISPDKLIDIWNSVAKGVPAPRRLVDLQTKLMRAPRRPARTLGAKAPVTTFDGTGPEFDLTPTAIPEGTLAAAPTCNNSCCDYKWLTGNIECSGTLDFSWIYFKRYSTWGRGDDAFFFRALACAATGPSHWRVHREGGPDKHWDIAEGWYRWYGSTGGTFNDPNVGSYVNEKAPFNMHSHCGIINF
jgi:hypothetical protein